VEHQTTEAFASALAEVLRIDHGGRLGPEVDLFDDWGIDSLQAFEMLIVIEAMSGALFPPAEIPAVFTIGDAFGYYEGLSRSVAEPGLHH
jgi:acyl carrier protein